MAATIRLTRMGKKKRPFYRLVVLDSRKRRDGAYLANLGYYNPFVEPYEVDLHTDEIIHWLKRGASLSDTARSLLKAEGIMYRFSLERRGLDGEEIARKVAVWKEGADERRARKQQQHAVRLQAESAARAEAEAEKAAELERLQAAEQQEDASDPPASGDDSATDAAPETTDPES